jgi:hypothetical protein
MPPDEIFMKNIAAVTLTFALCGCAAPSATMQKPGATTADYENDRSQCDYDAVKHAGGGSGVEMGVRQFELKQACMKSKGWQRKGS